MEDATCNAKGLRLQKVIYKLGRLPKARVAQLATGSYGNQPLLARP